MIRKKITITGFEVNGMSGIAILKGVGYRGIELRIPCENPTTCRIFDDVFGDFINFDYTVNEKAVIGKKIEVELDDLGLMTGFSVLEES